MRYTIVLICLLFLFGFRPSFAVEYIVGAGVSKATMPLNGIWYQKNLDYPPYNADMTNLVPWIGIRNKINNNLRYNLSFTNLGTYKLNAWATPADSNYDSTKHHCIGPCLPGVNYKTTGSLYGLTGTIELHNKHAGIEFGPFLYRSRFIVDAPNWYNAIGTPGNYQYDLNDIRPIYSDDREIQLGSVLGMSLYHGQWALKFIMFFDKQGFKGHNDPWVPNWRRHNVLIIHKSF